MKAVEKLPEGYYKIYAVDLHKNKKVALFVNILALAIAVLLVVPMHFVVPIFSLFSMENGMQNYIIRFVVLIVFMLLYMILHEFVHGIAMRICGTKKVKYRFTGGFNGSYALVGSKDYYDKKSYIFIALAPAVLWGIVLAVINPLVPIEWFWVVYLMQVINLSGAADDLFVTVRFSRFPSNILIQDLGVAMTVFSKK